MPSSDAGFENATHTGALSVSWQLVASSAGAFVLVTVGQMHVAVKSRSRHFESMIVASTAMPRVAQEPALYRRVRLGFGSTSGSLSSARNTRSS